MLGTEASRRNWRRRMGDSVRATISSEAQDPSSASGGCHGNPLSCSCSSQLASSRLAGGYTADHQSLFEVNYLVKTDTLRIIPLYLNHNQLIQGAGYLAIIFSPCQAG